MNALYLNPMFSIYIKLFYSSFTCIVVGQITNSKLFLFLKAKQNCSTETNVTLATLAVLFTGIFWHKLNVQQIIVGQLHDPVYLP